MTESINYLYRPQIYSAQLHREHLSFLRQGYTSYLTIPNLNNHLYYPAQLSLRAQDRIISELTKKQTKTQSQHIFLIVSLKLAGLSYHIQLSSFKHFYPNLNHTQQIDKYVEYFISIPPFIIANTNKQSIRWQYQKLLGKANSQGYFTIPDIPVFIINTKWLEHLYSNQQTNPPSINNEVLLQPTQFPLAQQKYLHYNYRIRQNLRENNDYKLLPYQAWQHLYNNYGGFEVKRFTTKEKEPIVEIWLIKISILVVQDRCVFHHLQLQVSKGDSLALLIERINIILKKYKIVPDKFITNNIGVFKSRQMDVNQVVSVLQDDSHPCIINHRFEKITDPTLDIQEVGIISPHDIIIINLGGEKGIFSKIAPLKVLSIRQKCLNCGTSQGLYICKCKSVYFCSQKCKESQKNHKKQCESVVTETLKYNNVIDYYQVTRRSFPDLKKIIQFGKVGLENLGNTCYMNAALQCLLRLQDLSFFFLVNGHIKDLNVSNVLGSEGHIACAYGELVKNFYTTNKRALEPADIRRCIAKNPQFRGFNHQDSQQFLNFFLDKLHQDLNRIRIKPYVQDIQSGGRPDDLVSRLSWQNYKKRNDSFISDILAGQYRSEIRCPDCNKLSITFDPFLSVTLQFPRPQKGENLSGYYMNQQGQFLRFQVQVKVSMLTYQFYQKYFKKPVLGAYLSSKQRKIVHIWDQNKSIFQNKQSSGLLFFFEKPHGYYIQLLIDFYTLGKDTLEYFSRIVFVKDINSLQDLTRYILLSIRKPLQKILNKDLTQEQYLQLCMQKQIILIRQILQNHSPIHSIQYPLTGVHKITTKVQLHYLKLTTNPPKLNASSGSYQGLGNSLIKKLKGQLSIPQLLQCFSQPQRLTSQNAWYCSNCKDHKLAEKAMSLYTLPQYLIVHLKRFNHRGDSGNRYIIYGEKVITPIALAEFEEIGGKRYQLVGIVNHMGSLTQGHYTACVKRDDWHNYDDSRCFKTKLDGKNAYLLFYKHVQ